MKNTRMWSIIWTMSIWGFVAYLITSKAYVILEEMTSMTSAENICKMGGKCGNS